VFWNMQAKLDSQLSRSSWIGDYDDANTFLNMFVTNDGQNRTGWSNPEYDALISEANEQTDVGAREKIFQHAESILVSNQVPIIPLFFYAGVMYYDTNKIQGIYANLLDDHPLEYIRKVRQ
jgi:oligopeptide transport system substrate-binding protein